MHRFDTAFLGFIWLNIGFYSFTEFFIRTTLIRHSFKAGNFSHSIAIKGIIGSHLLASSGIFFYLKLKQLKITGRDSDL